MNQQGAQVGIVTLTDTQQSIFAPATVLSGRKTQPSGHIPATFKLLAITDCANQGCGDNWANARNLLQTFGA